MSFFALNLLLFAEGLSNQRWALVSVASIVFIITLLNINRRRREFARDSGFSPRDIDPSLQEGGAVRRDLERLMLELTELSRQINAQIDTRFAKLEVSIIDADRRIDELRRLLERSGDRGLLQSGLAVADANRASLAPPLDDLPSLDLTIDDDGPPAAPPPDSGGSGRAAPRAEPPAAEGRHERVYQLADEGRPALEIARQTQLSVGEVELILKLRPPQAPRPPRPAPARTSE